MTPPDARPFLRRTARWTVVLGGAVAVLAAFTFGLPMALGVALGALVGFANLWLLAKAIGLVLERAEEHQPAPGAKWALPGVFLLKWPLVFLALGLILWYSPARPEGVGVGLVLTLVAGALAAMFTPRASSLDRTS